MAGCADNNLSTAMSDPLIDDLRQQIERGQAIAIVGAGVSIGATNNAPAASWVGLLKDGVARCEAVGDPRPAANWADRQRDALDGGDLTDLLSVTEQVSQRLGYPKGGEWSRWLRETVGALSAVDRSVLEALRDLGIPVATTNYDGLIEEVTGWPAVTWRKGAKVERVLRGDDPGVLHLHGHWDEPASVVLGIRSYEDVLRDAHAQAVQQAFRLGKTLVFMGFGAGLRDPNFGKLLVWSRDLFGGSEYRHYRLCRSGESDEIQKQHPPQERIFVRSFGAEHEDLAGFLRTLKPSGKAPESPSSSTAFVTPLPPKPARCLGRRKEVETLVGALLAGEPTPVLGPGGIGKSTICLEALHEERVVERFGARRFFVRCDGAKSAEDLLGAIAASLGTEFAPGLIGNVAQALGEAPAAVALDNLETPWEADTRPTEAVLSAIANIPGVALLVSLRGANRPGGVVWREAIGVRPLEGEDPRELFLGIAGAKHAGDKRLKDLLLALDGLPLAIELMAHAAEAEPDLKGIWQRWQVERTRMLSRAKGDHREIDLATSIELSLKSPRMTKGALRLLCLMGLMPDGLARGDLDELFDGCAAAAATLRKLALAFDEGHRFRCLRPVREYMNENFVPSIEDFFMLINHLRQCLEKIVIGESIDNKDLGNLKLSIQRDARNVAQIAIHASQIFLEQGMKIERAKMLMSSAQMYLVAQEYKRAYKYAIMAQALFHKLGENDEERNCLETLGAIAEASRDVV